MLFMNMRSSPLFFRHHNYSFSHHHHSLSDHHNSLSDHHNSLIDNHNSFSSFDNRIDCNDIVQLTWRNVIFLDIIYCSTKYKFVKKSVSHIKLNNGRWISVSELCKYICCSILKKKNERMEFVMYFVTLILTETVRDFIQCEWCYFVCALRAWR